MLQGPSKRKPRVLLSVERGWSCPKLVVLGRNQFCPPGNMWQYLETFWVLTTERLVPLASGKYRPEMFKIL